MCSKTDKEKVNDILAQVDSCLSEYPDWADDSKQDKYFAVALILTKTQMNLVKDALLHMATLTNS